jgi:hypothetical protein
MRGEHEQAILAGVPATRIRGAFEVVANPQNPNLSVAGRFVTNPNYKPLQP